MKLGLPPVVLGAQLAAARANEHEHFVQLNARATPFGAGMRYSFWSGQLDLVNPAKLPTDDAIAEMCRSYAASDAVARKAARSSTKGDDFYTLLTYSRRKAVFAMREGQLRHISDGLVAIAMIELNRIDSRDALVAIALHYGAAERIGEDPAPHFTKAAELAEPAVGDLIRGFLSRPADQKRMRPWGYEIVETPNGLGLVRTDGRPYKPTCPLHQVIIDLAQLTALDKYQPGEVTIASSLPPVWLSGVNDDALRQALQAVIAGANVNATLRPNESPDHEFHRLFMFVIEAADETTCHRLLQLSRVKAGSKKGIALLGVCHRRLFCLAIATCVVVGGKPIETWATLQRFSPGIEEVLKKWG